MDAPSEEELDLVRAAAAGSARASADYVVRWQSSYGLVIIEVQGQRVFVNGEFVEPAGQGDMGQPLQPRHGP